MATTMMLVKLHGVARSGRGVESQDFTNRLMEQFQFNNAVTTPLVFLPSDKLDFIVAPLDCSRCGSRCLGFPMNVHFQRSAACGVIWDWLFVAARRQTCRREGDWCGALLTRQTLRDPFGQRRVRSAT
jgi:hypothetical protein